MHYKFPIVPSDLDCGDYVWKHDFEIIKTTNGVTTIKMDDSDHTCKHCAFWRAMGTLVGECRRYAPETE